MTPFVERLATEEEKKAGLISREVLNRTPGELQRRYRKELPDMARRAGGPPRGRKPLVAGGQILGL